MSTDIARWVDVRHPVTNRLMFRFDPRRSLVEVSDKGVVAVVDLTRLTIEQRDALWGLPVVTRNE